MSRKSRKKNNQKSSNKAANKSSSSDSTSESIPVSDDVVDDDFFIEDESELDDEELTEDDFDHDADDDELLDDELADDTDSEDDEEDGDQLEDSAPLAASPSVVSRARSTARSSFVDRWLNTDNGKRLRARKVRRVVRHIDPWSVLAFSVVFHFVVVGALFIATLLLFVVANWLDLLVSFEDQIETLFNLETFEIRLRPLAQSMALFSFILMLLGTMMHVLFAVIFNLISDLVGGIRVTVIEEEVSASK